MSRKAELVRVNVCKNILNRTGATFVLQKMDGHESSIVNYGSQDEDGNDPASSSNRTSLMTMGNERKQWLSVG